MDRRPSFSSSVALQALAAGCLAVAASCAAASPADAARGRLLLTQYQCGACHVIPGVAGARGGEGPTLVAFGRRSYIAGQVPNRDDLLARWIVAPASLVADTPMPAMGASPRDARDMAAYLRTLR